MNSRSMNVLAVAATMLAACCALAFGSYTYPECATNGKGCCEFGTGSMRNRGYVIIALEGDDMVVTCSNSVLRCSYENPNKKASLEAAENVTCPGTATCSISFTVVLDRVANFLSLCVCCCRRLHFDDGVALGDHVSGRRQGRVDDDLDSHRRRVCCGHRPGR
jgi:hypothetical protein